MSLLSSTSHRLPLRHCTATSGSGVMTCLRCTPKKMKKANQRVTSVEGAVLLWSHIAVCRVM